MKLKTITLTTETEDGLTLTSVFVMPEYRIGEPTRDSLFKPMPKSPLKWFKEQMSKYINL